jgi:membrane-bound hydrogenase subunit mbhJ
MSFINQVLSRSLNVFHLAGSACNNCDIEILDALTPKYDLERFGVTLAASIRHADVLLLSGVFNKKSSVRLRRLYDEAPRPLLVVAVGGCPATGIIFQGSYNWDGPPGEYIPIDAYIPGCPPKPEAIVGAVVRLAEALRRGELVPKAQPAPGRVRPVAPDAGAEPEAAS